MNDFKHPSGLNVFQQYRRSVKVAKSTSRMKNMAWYQEPLDLDVQIHCYLKDGAGASCYLYIKSHNVFEKFDDLNSRQLEQPEELIKFIDSALSQDVCRGAKSLGVVLYLADEFSLAGLGPEYNKPSELASLRGMMRDDPKAILDDKTISTESHAWRLFPYPGATIGGEFATAVAVPCSRSNTLKILRDIGNEKNFPIKTCALSAPLCAIGLVPLFSQTNQEGGVCLFNYCAFTLMAFFNSQGDLAVMRYMPHANGAVMPSNIGPAIQSTTTALEMEKPDISVVSMVGNDVGDLSTTLQQSLPDAKVGVVGVDDLIDDYDLPIGCPAEFIAVTQKIDPELCPLVENETNTALREEGWNKQDFLSSDQDEIDMFPDMADMKVLRLGRRVRKIAALLVVAVLSYGGYNTFTKINSNIWKYQAVDHKAETEVLTNELKRYEHWDNLLMDRSKAWVCLELIARMMPADDSVILKVVKHDVRLKKENRGDKHGFSKEWIIDGFATDRGIEHLERHCTSEGINKLFLEVATTTENAAYFPDTGQRDITVSLVPRINPSYNSFNGQKTGSAFERTFKLSITQNITAEDEMALAAIEGVTR
ncbi:MAG: hypothetical protein P8P36_09275 [Akkermansiaceae bacterium]|nr:hypothetical protein [Akkermansiaceae bacterium]